MSDVKYILQLRGARLESIEQSDGACMLHFSQVQLVQEMDGAIEDSLWTQAVNISLKDAEIDGELPACPCEVSGGDITNNVFTYRDHAPLPIDWRGETGIKLVTAEGNSSVTVSGSSMKLEQIDNPRYIKHIPK